MNDHEEMLERHPAYKDAFFGNFIKNPDYNLIVRRRNKFAEITNLKKCSSGRMWFEVQPIGLYSKKIYRPQYDHMEFYRCTINYERRYMFMFHNYSVTPDMMQKYLDAGFQHLPFMYFASADSFQANAPTIREIIEIAQHPFAEKISKDIDLGLVDNKTEEAVTSYKVMP